MKKFLLSYLFPLVAISNGSYCMQDEQQKFFHLQGCINEAVLKDFFPFFYPSHSIQDLECWVCSPKFSPDGKLAVLPLTDGTAKIYEVATGKLIHNLTGHREAVNDASFNGDASKLVTASGDGTAKLWDMRDGQVISIIYHSDTVWSAKFSSDDRFVLTACQDGTAKICDATSGALLTVFNAPPAREYGLIPFWGARFSVDDSKIIGVLGNRTTCVWEITSSTLINVIEGGQGERSSSNFNHDGSKLIRALPNKTVQICENDPLKAGMLLCLIATLRLDQAEILRRAYETTQAGGVYEVGADSEELVSLGSIGRRKVDGKLQPRDERCRELQQFLKKMLNIRVVGQ